MLSSLLPQMVSYQTNKTVLHLFAAQVFFSVNNIDSSTLHLLKIDKYKLFFVSQSSKMGAILTKHIENAQPVIIEDKAPDEIDYFQILSRLDTPIITIESEDE